MHTAQAQTRHMHMKYSKLFKNCLPFEAAAKVIRFKLYKHNMPMFNNGNYTDGYLFGSQIVLAY